MKLLRMGNASTANVHLKHYFLSMVETILNYAEAFELQYGASFAEAVSKIIVDDRLPQRYLTEQWWLVYVRYRKFSRPMTRNVHILPLLEVLKEGGKSGEELWIPPFDIEVLHATRGGFVVLPIEAVEFYINNLTKSTAFHSLSFCW